MSTLYAEAEAQLGTRDGRKIGNNTYLERIDGETIGVRLHSTYVIRMTPEYVEIDSGGWHTVTTWNRMSDYGIRVASSKQGIAVYCRGENWETGGHPYYDGIRLTADGTRLTENQPALEPFMNRVITRSGWNGMTRQESHATRNRQFAALSAGDYDAFYRERDSLRGDTATLQPVRIEDTPLGTAAVYEMRQSDIAACPHVIFSPEHYRPDGSCRCNDPSHREMAEWGYTWNESESRWSS